MLKNSERVVKASSILTTLVGLTLWRYYDHLILFIIYITYIKINVYFDVFSNVPLNIPRLWLKINQGKFSPNNNLYFPFFYFVST